MTNNGLNNAPASDENTRGPAPGVEPTAFAPDVILTAEGAILPSLHFRAYALETGALVDVSDMARDAGFVYPVAITRALHDDIAAIPPAYSHEDVKGRLWDVLSMARFAIARSKDGGTDLTYSLILHVADRSQYQVQLSAGPGDRGEPVITLSHPGKDKNVPLGEIHLTEGALEAFADANASPGAFLCRHKSGDWGEVDADDQASNDQALREGMRLVSAYTIPQTGVRVWIITEWNRSQTTVLLPGEY